MFQAIGSCFCSFCHYGEPASTEPGSEILPTWRMLWVEFVNRTTWHGLKYLELRSRYLARKWVAQSFFDDFSKGYNPRSCPCPLRALLSKGGGRSNDWVWGRWMYDWRGGTTLEWTRIIIHNRLKSKTIHKTYKGRIKTCAQSWSDTSIISYWMSQRSLTTTTTIVNHSLGQAEEDWRSKDPNELSSLRKICERQKTRGQFEPVETATTQNVLSTHCASRSSRVAALVVPLEGRSLLRDPRIVGANCCGILYY